MRFRQREASAFGLLATGLVLLLLLHVGLGGSIPLSAGRILAEIAAGPGPGGPEHTIVWLIRLPRALGCVGVGFGLGVVGASFQAYFRNPLAEPFVIGVSSGAAVGGAACIVAGWGALLGGLALPLCSLVGGLGSLVLVVALSPRGGQLEGLKFLLAGVVLGAMLSGVMTLILSLGGQDSNQVLRWLLGSMTPMSWAKVALLFASGIAGSLILFLQARKLNLILLDPRQAAQFGLSSASLVLGVLVTGTVTASLAVGSVGVVGFLGMVSPHVARMFVGGDLRAVLPAAGLVGCLLLLTADILAQKLLPGTELPVGATMALIGAPILLHQLRTGK